MALNMLNYKWDFLPISFSHLLSDYLVISPSVRLLFYNPDEDVQT